MADIRADRKYRPQEWFDNRRNPGMTAFYLKHCLNQEYTRGELQGGHLEPTTRYRNVRHALPRDNHCCGRPKGAVKAPTNTP